MSAPGHLPRLLQSDTVDRSGSERRDNAKRRLHSLDGLRGVAAAVVVLHHVMLTSPTLSLGDVQHAPFGVAETAWWLTYTPLHLLWNGQQAVVLFFILSGYVLALPASNARTAIWASYYPRRLIRLYAPVWASLALALAWTVVAPRGFHADASWWTNLHQSAQHRPNLFWDLTLVRPGNLNSVLWSLTWEVLFSLLLPLYLLGGVLTRRIPWFVSVPLIAVVACLPSPAREAGMFMPVFAIGVALAFAKDDVGRWGQRVKDSQGARRAWWVLTAECLLGLNFEWTVHLVQPDPSAAAVHAARAIAIASGGLAIILATTCPGWRPVLVNPLVSWLGSRSFSLYLVHEPIVVSVALLLHSPPLGWTLLLSLPVSLVVTEAFYRLVERPSIRLAKRVGRGAARGQVGA